MWRPFLLNIVKYRLHVWLEVTTEDGDPEADSEADTAQTLLKKNGASHHSQSETQFIENVSWNKYLVRLMQSIKFKSKSTTILTFNDL